VLLVWMFYKYYDTIACVSLVFEGCGYCGEKLPRNRNVAKKDLHFTAGKIMCCCV
jgi:hypothetical protein